MQVIELITSAQLYSSCDMRFVNRKSY